MMTFLSACAGGLGSGFIFSFGFPMARGFPLLFFLAVCLVHAIQHERDPYLTFVR